MGCQESTLHGGVRGCTHVVERVEGQAFLLIQSAANGRGKIFLNIETIFGHDSINQLILTVIGRL